MFMRQDHLCLTSFYLNDDRRHLCSKMQTYQRIIARKSVSAGSLITCLSVKRFTEKLRLFLAFSGSELVDLGLHDGLT